jgi:circadian clock protein KaiB
VKIHPSSESVHQAQKPWSLKLFVATNSAASATAIVQLRRIVAEFLPQGSKVEIVDLLKEPSAVDSEQVLAIPTLIRKTPEPVRRIIGDLSDTDRVLVLLGIGSVR